MIRDTRRINIETNFYDDEDPYISKQQQETFYSTILHKQKGAIAMYNILDTIRLQRLINSFNCLFQHMETQGDGKASKFSSRLMLLKDLQDKRSLESQSVILRGGFGQERIEMRQKSQRSLSMKKRSLSASVIFNKEAHFLRKSRKRLLEHINKTFVQEPQNNARSKSGAKNLSASKYDKQTQEQPEKRTINSNKKISQKLQKLENLMKNIRRQKQMQLTTVVHQKKHLDYIPLKQNNGTHMQNFAQQIRCLRKQVSEVRQINESILEQSRSNNLRNSGNNENVKNNLLHIQQVIKAQMQVNKGIKEQVQSIPQGKPFRNNQISQNDGKQMKKQQIQNNSRQFLSRYNHNIHVSKNKSQTDKSNSSEQLPASLQKYKITTKIKGKTEAAKKKDEKLLKFQQYLAKRQTKQQKQANQQNQKILDKYKLKNKSNNPQRLKRQPSITQSQQIRTNIKNKNGKKQQQRQQFTQQKSENNTQNFKLNFPEHITKDPQNISQSYKDKQWYKQYGSPRIPISSFESSKFQSPNYKTADDLYNISTHRSYLNSQNQNNSPKYQQNYTNGSSYNYQSGIGSNYGTYGTTYESSSGINYGTNYEEKPYAYGYGSKKEDDFLNGYQKKYEYGNYGLSEYPLNASSDRNDVSSGYTNPQLLKELNLGEYRQTSNQKTSFDQNYTTTSPTLSYQNTSNLGTYAFESKHMPTILERQSQEYSKFGHYGSSNENGKNLIEGLNTANREWIQDGLGVSGYEGLYHKYSRDST